jgi:hypothetical protein
MSGGAVYLPQMAVSSPIAVRNAFAFVYFTPKIPFTDLLVAILRACESIGLNQNSNMLFVDIRVVGVFPQVSGMLKQHRRSGSNSVPAIEAEFTSLDNLTEKENNS